MARNDKKNLEDINKELKDSKKSTEEINKLQKEKIYLLEEEKRLQSESYSLSQQLVEDLKDELGIRSKRVSFDKDLLKVNKEITKAIQNQDVSVTSVDKKIKQIAKNDKLINKAKVSQLSLEKQLGENVQKRMGYAQSSITRINNLNNKLANGIDLSKEEINQIKSQIENREVTLSKQLKQLSAEERKYFITRKQVKELEKANKVRQTELDLAKKIEEKMGMAGKLGKLLGAIPGVGKIASSAVAEITKELEDAVEAGEELPSKTKIAGNIIGKMGKNILTNITDPFTLATTAVTFLATSLLEVDKASGEFAKNNGISYQNALAIRGEMNEIARSSNDVVVSSKALMETQGTLNTFFGQSTKFTGKLAEDMTSIAKRTGLSGEAQGLFALESMKTGKGVKDILKTQTLTVMEMNKEKGLQMSVKQVQEAIAKTSSAVYLTFKGNSSELTKQVMSAKALGSNMAQVEGIASSLLDFESSIQAELEAELLLGKDINLEKARQAALEGDMGKVAEEVLENKAIMNAFETKNVIAQEAAAKALGMNRDQLAGMIKEQEKLEAVRSAGFDSMSDAQKEYNKMRADGLSKEAAAAQIGDDNLASQLESVSAAEKLEGTMMKVQELFVALAEPILAIVQPIADIMVPAITAVADMITYITDSVSGLIGIFTGANEQLSLMQTIVGSIAIGYGSIIAIQKIKQGYDAIALLMEKRKKNEQKKGLLGLISEMAIKAFNALGGLPVVGPALGIAAAIAATALGYQYYSKAGDMMSPADGKTQVSTKEGGLFELSPNDDLIAAPGAANAMNKKGGGAGGNAALIAEVRTLININRQILSKSSTIEMNGNEVGKEISVSERSVQ